MCATTTETVLDHLWVRQELGTAPFRAKTRGRRNSKAYEAALEEFDAQKHNG